jgi:hypothetical protein
MRLHPSRPAVSLPATLRFYSVGDEKCMSCRLAEELKREFLSVLQKQTINRISLYNCSLTSRILVAPDQPSVYAPA